MRNTDEVLEYLVEEYPIDVFFKDESNFNSFLTLIISGFHQIHPNHKDFYSNFYIDKNSLFDKNKNTNLYRILRELEAFYKS